METLLIAVKKSVLFRFPVFSKIGPVVLIFSSLILLSCHTLASESALYPNDDDLMLMASTVDNSFLTEFLSLHLIKTTGTNRADEILDDIVENAEIAIIEESDNRSIYFYTFLYGDWSPFLMNWAFNANPKWEYDQESRILNNRYTGDQILFPNKQVLIFRKELKLEIQTESYLIQFEDDTLDLQKDFTSVTFYSPLFLKEILQVENDFPFTEFSCSLTINDDHKIIIDGVFQTESLSDSRACSIALKFFLLNLEKNQPSLLGDSIRNVQISVDEASADFNGLALHSAEEALYFLYSFKKEQDW